MVRSASLSPVTGGSLLQMKYFFYIVFSFSLLIILKQKGEDFPQIESRRGILGQKTTEGILPLQPSWLQWERCWAKGYWRKLDDSELLEKRDRYATHVQLKWMDNFTWEVPPQPNCPPFLEFDNAGFCAAVGGRDIVLIGDSLTNLFANAMLMLTWGRSRGGEVLPKGRFPYIAPYHGPLVGCVDWGTQPIKFVNLHNFARGNLKLAAEVALHPRISGLCNRTGTWMCKHVELTPGSEVDRIYGVDEFLENWAPSHGILPGVIVFNMGAHWEPDEILLPQVRDALNAASTALPDALIVWRNTVPGHANCSTATMPLKEPQDLSTIHPEWHWYDFARQNGRVRDMIAAEFPKVVYMDVYTATILRPDLHVSYFKNPPDDTDCLHYRSSMPAPTDHWVRVLYNVLIQSNINS